ncbi:hypothetical protein JCM5353_003964 [Sporobolomyces roseus]
MADEPATQKSRAVLTERALKAASGTVIRVLNDKTMKQCFPTYDDNLLQSLQQIVVGRYNLLMAPAWEDYARHFDFANKSNEFASIMDDAEERRARKEPPNNNHLIAADGNITIPSSTVPILRSATEELREKRLALAEQNAQTYQRIAQLSTSTTSSEQQIQKILDDFQKVLENVEAVDNKSLFELRDRMIKIVGQDL